MSGRGALAAPRRRAGSLRAATPLIVCAVGLLLAKTAPRGSATAADAVAASKHVAATGDVDAATLNRYVALAEAVYPQWTAYFRAEPKKADLPLRVDVRRDREAFLAALARAGVPPSAVDVAGGYFDPATKISFLYAQPHDSSTRLLVLHELTHQFQSKAALDGQLSRSPMWHKEGLAEHFGHHRRTADGVETGALDVVTIDERPTQCAERVAKGTFDPWAVGTLVAKAPDYTDALALVETLLRTRDKGLIESFRRFEADIAGGGDAGKKFEREFAGKKERLEAAAREVWGGFRRTWKIVYIGWDEDLDAPRRASDAATSAPVIVGTGLPWAFLLGGADLPRERTSIEATVRLASPAAVAGGIAIGCKGPDDLIDAELRAGGRVVLRRKQRGVWYDLATHALSMGVPPDGVRLRLEASGSAVRLIVDGALVASVDGALAGFSFSDTEGRPGLCAESGPVRFSGVKFALER